MKIHNLEQQSKEWFDCRKGHLTASHAQAIGNSGKGLDTYVLELMSEYYSSGEKEHYTNKHTERGNELEPIARDIYEIETGNKVDEVGFCEMSEFIGCSPDGLVEEDGGIEIKSIDDKGYFDLLINESIDSSYLWQIQMNLLVTERKWWDFVAYNPNFEKSIYIKRIYPNDEKIEKLKTGIEKAINLINKIKSSYENLRHPKP